MSECSFGRTYLPGQRCFQGYLESKENSERLFQKEALLRLPPERMSSPLGLLGPDSIIRDSEPRTPQDFFLLCL